MSQIDYLCVGHVCHDVTPTGLALGGTASYASIVARQLGRQSGIHTSFGDDFLFEKFFHDREIPITKELSESTTTFENKYTDAGRIQYMHNRASVLNSVPLDVSTIPIIHLCLIADELSADFVSRLPPQSLIGLAVQGALRAVDSNHLVHPKWLDIAAYQGVDVVFLSDDDMIGLDGVDESLATVIPVVVVTHGKDGATVTHDGFKTHYPSYPTTEVDPTGAGDVFGAAFLIAYADLKNIDHACSFAHAAASLSVEGQGVRSLPSRAEVVARQALYQEHFKK